MHKELLFSINKNDFEIQTFRSGGKGGQHQNKTDSGVRIIHKASGARGECRNHRSQYMNKREALKRLTECAEFKMWINRMVYEILEGESIEHKVEKAMAPDNIKIEVKDDNNKWVDLKEIEDDTII